VGEFQALQSIYDASLTATPNGFCASEHGPTVNGSFGSGSVPTYHSLRLRVAPVKIVKNFGELYDEVHSPLISWEEYQAKLAQFIAHFNQTPHERTSLEGGATIVPHAEYIRLYRTRYDIAPETVSLLLMKTDSRVLQKNEVNCFKTKRHTRLA
jgi:hypothetical protein